MEPTEEHRLRLSGSGVPLHNLHPTTDERSPGGKRAPTTKDPLQTVRNPSILVCFHVWAGLRVLRPKIQTQTRETLPRALHRTSALLAPRSFLTHEIRLSKPARAPALYPPVHPHRHSSPKIRHPFCLFPTPVPTQPPFLLFLSRTKDQAIVSRRRCCRYAPTRRIRRHTSQKSQKLMRSSPDIADLFTLRG